MGVVAVYTWADMEKDGVDTFSFPAMFPNADGKMPEMTPRRSLAHEVVRHVGEAVVAVVAETREQAQDASELVEIDYDQLPSVTEIEDALKPGAPQIWAGAPAMSPASTASAMPPSPMRPSRQPPMSCRSTSSISA